MKKTPTNEYIDVEDSKDVIFFKASLTATIFKRKPGLFVSYCQALDLYSQGPTIEEAEKNIIEATHLFIESCIEHNTLREVLEECGFYSINLKKPERKAKDQSVVGSLRQIKIPTEFPVLVHG